jgi:hypothetical protein
MTRDSMWAVPYSMYHTSDCWAGEGPPGSEAVAIGSTLEDRAVMVVVDVVVVVVVVSLNGDGPRCPRTHPHHPPRHHPAWLGRGQAE